MTSKRFLWLAIVLSISTQPLSVVYAMPPEEVTKSSAKRTSAVEDVDVDESEDGRHPQVKLIPANISPGFFYRPSMQGVYTISAHYYDEELFQDTQKIQTFINAQDIQNQYLGVVFFGIWSYSDTEEEKGETDESLTTIEIPIRQIKDKKMYHQTSTRENRYHPRLIWKTGHGSEEPVKIGDFKYYTIPCRGKHTEKMFKKFIKDGDNQTALWDYFLHKSQNVKATNKKLDLIGFKCYSINDACETCFDTLFSLQTNHKTILSTLFQRDELKIRPVPFIITFHSRKFYYPQNDDEAGSSIHFYSDMIKPIIELDAFADPDTGYHCIPLAFGEKFTDTIKHQEKIQFKELQQPEYIILKVKDGDSKKVTLKYGRR